MTFVLMVVWQTTVFGRTSFQLNVRSILCLSVICLSVFCPSAFLSFRLNVFWLYVHSVKCLCHMSFRSRVFCPYVRSAIYPSALCSTTVASYLYTTAQLYLCTTAQLYHCTTAQLYHCTTVALHNTMSLIAQYYYRKSCHLIKNYPVLGM